MGLCIVGSCRAGGALQDPCLDSWCFLQVLCGPQPPGDARRVAEAGAGEGPLQVRRCKVTEPGFAKTVLWGAWSLDNAWTSFSQEKPCSPALRPGATRSEQARALSVSLN